MQYNNMTLTLPHYHMRILYCKRLQTESQILYAIETIRERGYAHCGVYGCIPNSSTTCYSQWFRTQSSVSRRGQQQNMSKIHLQS